MYAEGDRISDGYGSTQQRSSESLEGHGKTQRSRSETHRGASNSFEKSEADRGSNQQIGQRSNGENPSGYIGIGKASRACEEQGKRNAGASFSQGSLWTRYLFSHFVDSRSILRDWISNPVDPSSRSFAKYRWKDPFPEMFQKENFKIDKLFSHFVLALYFNSELIESEFGFYSLRFPVGPSIPTRMGSASKLKAGNCVRVGPMGFVYLSPEGLTGQIFNVEAPLEVFALKQKSGPIVIGLGSSAPKLNLWERVLVLNRSTEGKRICL